jgi:hypothetical protein
MKNTKSTHTTSMNSEMSAHREEKQPDRIDINEDKKENKRGFLKTMSFTTENIEEFIKKCKSQQELLPLYLDKIRNGYIFTDEMLENISNFDDKSKMKIISEYNRCMVYFNELSEKK